MIRRKVLIGLGESHIVGGPFRIPFPTSIVKLDNVYYTHHYTADNFAIADVFSVGCKLMAEYKTESMHKTTNWIISISRKGTGR